MKRIRSIDNPKNSIWSELYPINSNATKSYELFYKFIFISDDEIERMKDYTFEDWLKMNYDSQEDIDYIISFAGIFVAARKYSSAYEIWTMLYAASFGTMLYVKSNYNDSIINPIENHLNKYIDIKKNSRVKELIYNDNNEVKHIITTNNEIIEGDLFVISTFKEDMFKLYDIDQNLKKKWHSEYSIAFNFVVDNKNNVIKSIKKEYKLEIMSPWHIIWFTYCNKTWPNDKYFQNNKNIVIFSVVISDVDKEGEKIKKSVYDCNPDEILTELLYQMNLNEEIIRQNIIPDKNGRLVRFGDNIKYENNKFSFTDPLTINLPNGKSLDANTHIKNLFIAGEHVKSHIWQIPTMEQACESGFECFKKIEESQGKKYVIPYETNIHNLLPLPVKVLRNIYIKLFGCYNKCRQLKNTSKIFIIVLLIFLILIGVSIYLCFS